MGRILLSKGVAAKARARWCGARCRRRVSNEPARPGRPPADVRGVRVEYEVAPQARVTYNRRERL